MLMRMCMDVCVNSVEYIHVYMNVDMYKVIYISEKTRKRGEKRNRAK